MKKTIVCLVGPTAVGKSEVALRLAKRIGAEIISCDSMQVYKWTDIASSKPTKAQRRAVPHHLIDIVTARQGYNAARFRTQAEKIIKDIHKRGRIPLIAGGSGLYLRALLDGLFSGPGKDAGIRKKLCRQAARYGRAYLYRRLQAVDPRTALKVNVNDLRRIIRALEVYEQTKQPISQWHQKTSGIRDKYTVYILGLRRPRVQLYTRIEKRVEQMFRRGLVAEMRKLSKLKLSQTARFLLGYKEIKGFLNGEYTQEEAKGLLQRNTRRFAKRQISWFNHQEGIRWLDVGSDDSPRLITERIVKLLN